MSIPDKQIIEAAESCGLYFGVERQTVRSEVIKNALLQKIPQLQWVGINTRGCTATISVREKTKQDIEVKTPYQVSSIIAGRDGIIQSCTVYQGTPLCTAGQAVKAGQILVSGYTDCGLTVMATRADAEVTALTCRSLEILTPSAAKVRKAQISAKRDYAIRIGKKLINLSKDSGNSDTSCVRIYSEKFARLPGGFYLPISLIKITNVQYSVAPEEPSDIGDGVWLEEFSREYLMKSMVAGKVISTQSDIVLDDKTTCLRGRFVCLEMIGQIMNEQKLLKD
jgi:sporulation protein YqfD